MPQEYGDERLIFKLSSEDAVELDRLGDGFAALAREFNRLLGDAGIGPADARAKLFVTNIRYSSVEFELATLSGLYLLAHATAEGFVLWTEFYNRIRDGLEFLAGRAARPKGFDHIEARNLDSFLNTVAGKRGAKIGVRRARYHHKSRRRETIAEFEFTEQDVANAQMTLAREISGIMAQTHQGDS